MPIKDSFQVCEVAGSDWRGSPVPPEVTHPTGNPSLTKLRIQADRARRTYDAVEKSARQAIYQAQLAWQNADKTYLDEAERQGYCRICLRLRSEGNHDGPDHIVIAMAGPAE